MPKGVKGFQKGHETPPDTRKKIGDALRRPYYFTCEYCREKSVTKLSAFKKKKRHFCSMKCYSKYREEILPKWEQHAYKNGGLPLEEKGKRIKARSDINHAIGQGKVIRKSCEKCDSKKSQAHHHDYNKPLKVKWLCKKCHWKEHERIYENPKLLKGQK